MKIAVAGIGYARASKKPLLSQDNEAVAVDIIQSRNDLPDSKKIKDFPTANNLTSTATCDSVSDYRKSACSETIILYQKPAFEGLTWM